MADLCIERREGCGLATIMLRKGVNVRRVAAALKVEAPLRPERRKGKGGLSLIGTGAGSWLAQADDADAFWAEGLRARLAGIASVSDQTSGYVIVRVSGPAARVVLQRGMPIDLHPDSFAPGSVATTVIAHIGAIVWQVDERPTYDIAIFRSFSESFDHWLEQSVAALPSHFKEA